MAARADSLQLLWTQPCRIGRRDCRPGRRTGICQSAAISQRWKQTPGAAWRQPLSAEVAKRLRRPQARGASLLAHAGTVYAQNGARLAAFAANSGKLRWENKEAPSNKGEAFVAAGLIWLRQGSTVVGYDLATGEHRKTVDASAVFSEGHHPRCYREKATDCYVITNNRGAEFVSLNSNDHVQNDWVRGNCGHGILPANGLLYAPPNQCFCYPGVKLMGFNALAPAARTACLEEGPPLDRGPAYDEAHPIPNPQSSMPSTDWPTYRHDGGRLGFTPTSVDAHVKPAWQATLGGRLTPPVLSEGRLYVAAKDEHTSPPWRLKTAGSCGSSRPVGGSIRRPRSSAIGCCSDRPTAGCTVSVPATACWRGGSRPLPAPSGSSPLISWNPPGPYMAAC